MPLWTNMSAMFLPHTDLSSSLPYLIDHRKENPMSKHIAIVGKGGAGKTTFTTMICRYLIANKKGTILAVDADPNANLNEALGLELPTTISEMIEDTKRPKAIPEGMSKEVYYKIQQSLVETKTSIFW